MAHTESSTPPSTQAKPPGLPEIRDEAASTPMWIPGLGLGVFLLATLWMIFSSVWADEVAAEGVTQEAAEVPAEVDPA